MTVFPSKPNRTKLSMQFLVSLHQHFGISNFLNLYPIRKEKKNSYLMHYTMNELEFSLNEGHWKVKN